MGFIKPLQPKDDATQMETSSMILQNIRNNNNYMLGIEITKIPIYIFKPEYSKVIAIYYMSNTLIILTFRRTLLCEHCKNKRCLKQSFDERWLRFIDILSIPMPLTSF